MSRAPDPSRQVTAAVLARVASERLERTFVPVAAGRRNRRGHLAATPLHEDPTQRSPLCRRRAPGSGLHPVPAGPARLLAPCGSCLARVLAGAITTDPVAPTRAERAAYYAAAITTAAGRGDAEAREAAISCCIQAGDGLVAQVGTWLPGSDKQVPLHALIALWRDRGEYAEYMAGLRAQPEGRYRSGHALSGARR